MPRSRTGWIQPDLSKSEGEPDHFHLKTNGWTLIRSLQLKCTEERPSCAQCLKANRECIQSSGITFRHQQNPSMNGQDHGEGSLKSFYGYKETFGKGTHWVDIPRDLTFVHTSNPYDEDEGGRMSGRRASQRDDSALAALAENASRYEEQRRGGEFDLSQAAYPAYATHGLEALSAVASQDFNFGAPTAAINSNESLHQQTPATSSSQPGQAPPTQLNNLDFILNTPLENSNIDPRLHSETPSSAPGQPQPTPTPITQSQSPTHVRTTSYPHSFGARPRLHAKGPQTRKPAINDPELAFLLRDFSERAGEWMDLFDLNLFFATKVPVLAVRCPLLLFSCAALSAKSLARVDGRKPVMNGQITQSRRSKMECWPGRDMSVEGWVRKARELYDLAVSLLRQALAGASRPPTSSFPENTAPETTAAAQVAPLPTTDSDELVAATAILCVYEFLDASGTEWSRHLDGAKSLFDIAKDRMVPLTIPPSPVPEAQHLTQSLSNFLDGSDITQRPERALSQGRRAVFWNFARQDMLAAFIHNTETRLDTADLQMWRSAGLKLTTEGFVCPSNPTHPEYEAEHSMPEDMISNALIWFLMKLVNFISAGDEVPNVNSPLVLGVRQQELLEYWEALDEQFRVWFEGLPDCFHASAVYPEDSESGMEEKWFPRPMCASTIQSYHFARIQLLHNKPALTTAGPSTARQNGLELSASPGSSLAARHASYSAILQQSRAHAKEIVAIGLGRSDEGTRIHSVQPLWTAGLVLGGTDEGGEADEETQRWRRCIITQLRGIERDMGWASEYRVQSLLQLWNLPMDWSGQGVES